MKFNLVCEDVAYVEAIKQYYLKHYQNKFQLVFNDKDMHCVVICDIEKKPHEQTLIFSDRNQVMSKEIKKYQSGEKFMTFLMSIREEELRAAIPLRTFGFFNLISCSGSTTLSLNLAKALTQRGKTLWFSLEKIPSTMFYLERKSGFSLSDMVFYTKQNDELLIQKLSEWQCQQLYWFDSWENLEDQQAMATVDLCHWFHVIEKAGFSHVVIDFGQHQSWYKDYALSHKLGCCRQSLSHYYRLNDSFSLQNQKKLKLLVNLYDPSHYVSDALLKLVDHYDYIEKDYDLQEARQWSSQTIQKKMLNDLNLT